MISELQPQCADSAWTNFIRLQESPETAATKLVAALSHDGSPWGLGAVSISHARGKEASARIAERINAEKQRIAASTGLPISAIPFLRGKSDQYFYLAPGAHCSVDPASESPLIVCLCLLSALTGRSTIGSNALRLQSIGPYLYLGTQTFAMKSGGLGIDGFELELNLRHGQLQPNLSKVSRVVDKDAITTGLVFLDEQDPGFALSAVAPRKFGRLDARKSPRKEITFVQKHIRHSRLYLLNRLSESLCDILTRAGVSHERIRFAPRLVVDHPRPALALLQQTGNDLLIVNNTGGVLGEESRAVLQDALTQDGIRFGTIRFHNAGASSKGDSGWIDSIRPGLACLVLNEVQDENASIAIEGEFHSRPWLAYHGLDEGRLDELDVDAYTAAKYRLLYRQIRPHYPVLQGVNVTLADGEIALPACRSLKKGVEFDYPVIRRCAVELTLKSHYARGCIPLRMEASPSTQTSTDVSGTYTLIHTDRVKLPPSEQEHSTNGRSGKPEILTMVAIVRIEVDEQSIHILDTRFWPNVGGAEALELIERYPCLAPRITGDAFYLLDERDGSYLRRWSGKILPKIILNSRYSDIESALTMLENGGGLSAKGTYSRDTQWALLPYHTKPGLAAGRHWKDLTYLEDHGMFLRYFVPSLQPANSQMPFSNLQDLMIYRPQNGRTGTHPPTYAPQQAGLLDERLARLYLGTLSNGILRLNQSSKSSLLEKIARLAGMDT